MTRLLLLIGSILAGLAAMLIYGALRLGLFAALNGIPLPSPGAVSTLASSLHPSASALAEKEVAAIRAGPLAAALAQTIARLLSHRLLVQNGPVGGSLSTDIEFRVALEEEVASILESPSGATRDAFIHYAKDPYGPRALDGFMAENTDWDALRRLAILAQPVRPLTAMEVYGRANEIKPDPFLQIQLLNLRAATGNLPLARSIQNHAARQWPNDMKVQAILAAKDGMLDILSGTWATWQEKYRRALALNLQLGRWEAAATNAAVLGDMTIERPDENGELVGGDNLDALRYLRQALDLATRAGADDIVARAALALSRVPAIGNESIDISPAQATALRAQALKASRRHGNLEEYLRLADGIVAIERSHLAFPRAEAIAREMQAEAAAQNSAWGIALALRLRSVNAMELGRLDDAEALLKEADGYAILLPAGNKAALLFDHARLANVRHDPQAACQHLRQASKLYGQIAFPDGVAYAENLLREWRCGR